VQFFGFDYCLIIYLVFALGLLFVEQSLKYFEVNNIFLIFFTLPNKVIILLPIVRYAMHFQYHYIAISYQSNAYTILLISYSELLSLVVSFLYIFLARNNY